MGYYTTFDGSVNLGSDRLSDEQVDRLQGLLDDVFYEHVEATHTGFDIGYLEGKYYGFEDDFRQLVDWLIDLGYTPTGSVVATGEEPGDVWRVIIRDGKVVREKARILWPDGTEYTK